MKAKQGVLILLLPSVLLAVSVSAWLCILFSGWGQYDAPTWTEAQPSVPRKQQPMRTHDLGQQIVQKAFKDSFADLAARCNDDEESPREFMHCLKRLYKHARSSTATTREQSWPWWFQTMLRDVPKPSNGMAGSWHYLQFPEQPMPKLCIYGKGATKQWRKVHCDAWNQQFNAPDDGRCYEIQGTPDPNASKAVFLRDPLERFLSAFLDKCTGRHMTSQPHCEPSIVFQNEEQTHVVTDFLNDTTKLFEIYVDTFPVRCVWG